MQNFDIIKKSTPNKTFRVASVIGKFDLQSETIEERFTGELNLPDFWNIGIIVGKSGTGKTTIAKELFNDFYINDYKYKEKSILDDMPKKCSLDDITKSFNAVGFSSPPSWLKSYNVLSNGEKMRVDLARALLENKELFVFDEFTSVVDRNIAKIGSLAVQKTIRKKNKKFIAVTCHYDIIDWLIPDWIFDTDTMTFQNIEKQKKNKPKVKFEIYQTKDKSIWKVFAKYHYLSHNHNNAAIVYVCFVNNVLAGFISILHTPHPKVKNLKRVHRLVILPDFQGIGIGVRLLEEVGKKYLKEKYRFTITTSAPSLIFYFKKNIKWKLKNFGRKQAHGGLNKVGNFDSSERITTSWEYNV